MQAAKTGRLETKERKWLPWLSHRLGQCGPGEGDAGSVGTTRPGQGECPGPDARRGSGTHPSGLGEQIWLPPRDSQPGPRAHLPT